MAVKFVRKTKEGQAYKTTKPRSEKLTLHLGEKVIINGFRLEPTENYGDVLIIDTNIGELSTFSSVVRQQLEEWKEFPVEARFLKQKNYITMAEP